MYHIIEIRSLSLKPSTREKFHRLYMGEALPRPKRWTLDVVAITAGIETLPLSSSPLKRTLESSLGGFRIEPEPAGFIPWRCDL